MRFPFLQGPDIKVRIKVNYCYLLVWVIFEQGRDVGIALVIRSSKRDEERVGTISEYFGVLFLE
jgi:hypothetical protein